ncbi:unnamed protein product [Amoebophrya sp. A25]|nr:unnamed protein product [Amoebophrya sp. A25]|eukprot:GSA25T00005480001.1
MKAFRRSLPDAPDFPNRVKWSSVAFERFAFFRKKNLCIAFPPADYISKYIGPENENFRELYRQTFLLKEDDPYSEDFFDLREAGEGLISETEQETWKAEPKRAVLTEEQGSDVARERETFLHTDFRTRWVRVHDLQELKKTAKEFFDVLRRIRERKQVNPGKEEDLPGFLNSDDKAKWCYAVQERSTRPNSLFRPSPDFGLRRLENSLQGHIIVFKPEAGKFHWGEDDVFSPMTKANGRSANGKNGGKTEAPQQKQEQQTPRGSLSTVQEFPTTQAGTKAAREATAPAATHRRLEIEFVEGSEQSDESSFVQGSSTSAPTMHSYTSEHQWTNTTSSPADQVAGANVATPSSSSTFVQGASSSTTRKGKKSHVKITHHQHFMKMRNSFLPFVSGQCETHLVPEKTWNLVRHGVELLTQMKTEKLRIANQALAQEALAENVESQVLGKRAATLKEIEREANYYDSLLGLHHATGRPTPIDFSMCLCQPEWNDEAVLSVKSRVVARGLGALLMPGAGPEVPEVVAKALMDFYNQRRSFLSFRGATCGSLDSSFRVREVVSRVLQRGTDRPGLHHCDHVGTSTGAGGHDGGPQGGVLDAVYAYRKAINPLGRVTTVVLIRLPTFAYVFENVLKEKEAFKLHQNGLERTPTEFPFCLSSQEKLSEVLKQQLEQQRALRANEDEGRTRMLLEEAEIQLALRQRRLAAGACDLFTAVQRSRYFSKRSIKDQPKLSPINEHITFVLYDPEALARATTSAKAAVDEMQNSGASTHRSGQSAAEKEDDIVASIWGNEADNDKNKKQDNDKADETALPVDRGIFANDHRNFFACLRQICNQKVSALAAEMVDFDPEDVLLDDSGEAHHEDGPDSGDHDDRAEADNSEDEGDHDGTNGRDSFLESSSKSGPTSVPRHDSSHLDAEEFQGTMRNMNNLSSTSTFLDVKVNQARLGKQETSTRMEASWPRSGKREGARYKWFQKPPARVQAKSYRPLSRDNRWGDRLTSRAPWDERIWREGQCFQPKKGLLQNLMHRKMNKMSPKGRSEYWVDGFRFQLWRRKKIAKPLKFRNYIFREADWSLQVNTPGQAARWSWNKGTSASRSRATKWMGFHEEVSGPFEYDPERSCGVVPPNPGLKEEDKNTAQAQINSCRSKLEEKNRWNLVKKRLPGYTGIKRRIEERMVSFSILRSGMLNNAILRMVYAPPSKNAPKSFSLHIPGYTDKPLAKNEAEQEDSEGPQDEGTTLAGERWRKIDELEDIYQVQEGLNKVWQREAEIENPNYNDNENGSPPQNEAWMEWTQSPFMDEWHSRYQLPRLAQQVSDKKKKIPKDPLMDQVALWHVIGLAVPPISSIQEAAGFLTETLGADGLIRLWDEKTDHLMHSAEKKPHKWMSPLFEERPEFFSKENQEEVKKKKKDFQDHARRDAVTRLGIGKEQRDEVPGVEGRADMLRDMQMQYSVMGDISIIGGKHLRLREEDQEARWALSLATKKLLARKTFQASDAATRPSTRSRRKTNRDRFAKKSKENKYDFEKKLVKDFIPAEAAARKAILKSPVHEAVRGMSTNCLLAIQIQQEKEEDTGAASTKEARAKQDRMRNVRTNRRGTASFEVEESQLFPNTNAEAFINACVRLRMGLEPGKYAIM